VLAWCSKKHNCDLMHLLEAQNLSYIYHDGTRALDAINFIAKRGEIIAVLGANGAGKTTLLKHFNGILKPTSGAILVKGEPITKKNILNVRKTVGLVFQDPDDQIFAPTVRQDVAFGPMNLGLPKDVVEHRVEKSLELVGMTGYEDKAPHHLSSGQKKRVAIAGILAMRPEVLVLDEPTANLDPNGVAMMGQLIRRLNDNGMTIIVATQDVDEVPLFADRVVILSNGRMVMQGTPKEVFSQSDAIEKAGLRLPLIAQLFESLREEGVSLDTTPLTLGEARQELLRILRA